MKTFINKRIIFFFVVFEFGIVIAQAQITPCSRIPLNKKEENYEKTIDSIFSVYFNDDYLIRFFAMPSFDPEYGFQIKRLQTGQYQVKTLFFNNNLWYSINRKDICIFERNDTIETGVVDKMVSLLENYFDHNFDNTCLHNGIDGITFRIEILLNDTFICCEFWEPDDDNPFEEIISSAMEIIHLYK